MHLSVFGIQIACALRKQSTSRPLSRYKYLSGYSIELDKELLPDNLPPHVCQLLRQRNPSETTTTRKHHVLVAGTLLSQNSQADCLNGQRSAVVRNGYLRQVGSQALSDLLDQGVEGKLLLCNIANSPYR